MSSDDVLVQAVQELAEQKPLADASTGRFRYPDASTQTADELVDLTIEPATSAKTDEEDALRADAETAGGAMLPILTPPTGEYFYFNWVVLLSSWTWFYTD